MILTATFSESVRSWMNGAISMGYLVVACFFLQYWRETRDRLFVFFTIGFVVLAANRTLYALMFGDVNAVSFTLRLAGYLLILAGIIDRRLRPV
jgi:hypothetical protein